MTVYKDPVTLSERVSFVVSLPSGVTDVGFSLLGNGPATTLAAITYTWPKILYEVDGLFESAIKDPTKSLPPTHPKIIALKLELENNRKHIEAAP